MNTWPEWQIHMGRMYWRLREHRQFLGNLKQRVVLRLRPYVAPTLWPDARQQVETFLTSLPSPSCRPWKQPSQMDCPLEEAKACMEEHGAWPISFSYPRAVIPADTEPRELISTVLPSVPYSFDDEADYMASYRRAYFAITHRKAGWDCFRHVEILAAGSIPLMLDVDEIPRYSMVHYPKAAMKAAMEHVRMSPDVPDAETITVVSEFFQEHLTSSAMAEYMLRVSGLRNVESVLFVDKQIPAFPDYQSVLALIGLKQLLGSECHVMYPTDYIYADWAHPTDTLYGRGFGYTRVLSPDQRSKTERNHEERDAVRTLRDVDYDAVIVGSISRNAPIAYRVLRRFPARRTIWIHGEDRAPSSREMRVLRSAGTHLFVRAIPTRN